MLAVKSELFGEEVRQATEEGLQETSQLLDDLSQLCSTGPKRNNPAYAAAQKAKALLRSWETPRDNTVRSVRNL